MPVIFQIANLYNANTPCIMSGNEVTNVTNHVKFNGPLRCTKSADALGFTSSNHMYNVGSNSNYTSTYFLIYFFLVLLECFHSFIFHVPVRHLDGNNGFVESNVWICILAPCRISCGDAEEIRRVDAFCWPLFSFIFQPKWGMAIRPWKSFVSSWRLRHHSYKWEICYIRPTLLMCFRVFVLGIFLEGYANAQEELILLECT